MLKIAMNCRRIVIVLAALGFGLSAVAAHAAGALTVPKKVRYEKGIYVPDAVRAECSLETKLAEHVREAAGAKYQVKTADSVSNKTPGRALGLTITHVLAPGGGPFSGPKSVAVRGVLWENGKQVGSFVARRNTTHGGGTCNMLERDAKEIADDIAKWLEAPGKDDKLGDAK